MDLRFSTVRERDMDLLFLEAVSTDIGFARLIVDRTKWAGKPFIVESVELSRTEGDLGESDITVVISAEGAGYGILIEDKIDAAAMPNQHRRYIERGKRGIAEGKYDDFDIMIVCPEKYYRANEEAKLYENRIFYEEFEEYFAKQSDIVSRVRRKQVQAALNKAKKPPTVTVNEAANTFFNHYRDYQRSRYPHLDLRTGEDSNGWWTHYGVHFGKAYIYHKMQEGFVDLTFPNAADSIDTVANIARWLKSHGMSSILAVITGKAAALRIEVPKLKVLEPFGCTAETDIEACFKAVSDLAELAEVFFCADRIKDIRKKKA